MSLTREAIANSRRLLQLRIRVDEEPDGTHALIFEHDGQVLAKYPINSKMHDGDVVEFGMGCEYEAIGCLGFDGFSLVPGTMEQVS